MKLTISGSLTKDEKARLLHRVRQIRAIAESGDILRRLDEFRIVSAVVEGSLIGEKNQLIKAICYYELAYELKSIEDDLTEREERYIETLKYLEKANQQTGIPAPLKAVILNYMGLLTITRGKVEMGISLFNLAKETICRRQGVSLVLIRIIDANIDRAREHKEDGGNYYVAPEMRISENEFLKAES